MPEQPERSSRGFASTWALWAGMVLVLAISIFALVNSWGSGGPPRDAATSAPGSTLPVEILASPTSAQPAKTLPPPTPVVLDVLSLVYQSANGSLSIRYPAGWEIADDSSTGADSARVRFASIRLDSSASPMPNNYVGISINLDSIESIRSATPAWVEFYPVGILAYLHDQQVGTSGNGTQTPETYSILQDVQGMTLSGYPAASLIVQTQSTNTSGTQKAMIEVVLIMTDYDQAATIYVTGSVTGWEVNKVILDRMLASLIIKKGVILAPSVGPQPAPTALEQMPPAVAPAPTEADTPPPLPTAAAPTAMGTPPPAVPAPTRANTPIPPPPPA